MMFYLGFASSGTMGALGRTARDENCVCELHFKEDDIIRHFDPVKLKDGRIFTAERKIILLKSTAVPLLHVKKT